MFRASHGHFPKGICPGMVIVVLACSVNAADDKASQARVREVLQLKETVLHLAFSPDGKTFVTGDVTRQAEVRQFPSGKSQARFGEKDFGPLDEVAFAPDGKLLAVASSFDGGIVVWDVAEKSCTPFAPSRRGGSPLSATRPLSPRRTAVEGLGCGT